ncbi:uncharacterized protein A4U43_C05F6310 [Asparagus officinalis]|uniref:BTB domain-containing protein n=1 Tax=Asparagus officinalis TaxID=4686 RepID=A0A5P1EQ13_ASPOF|nr:uncharacterized protein A4U43_C05F6310 [Asparagus officinalis]
MSHCLASRWLSSTEKVNGFNFPKSITELTPNWPLTAAVFSKATVAATVFSKVVVAGHRIRPLDLPLLSNPLRNILNLDHQHNQRISRVQDHRLLSSKGLGIGKYIASDSFSVGGFEWAIYFYPDGKSPEDNASYVSLFIALASEGTDVRALFELTMLDQSGKERHKIHTHFGRLLQDGPYTLKYRGSMWGYKRFFKRTALEASDYLKDDCLSISCSVGVVRSHTEGPKSYNIPVPPSNITQHVGQLLESGERTDVSFKVDDEIFAAHRLVLAARSPVFRAQLFGPMKDRDMRCIEVEDMQPAVFKALLHFIYWDCLPEMEDLTGVALTLMSQHLLAGADRYALERLKLLCEEKLCEDVSINTVATTLALAEQHHCFQLKTVCLRFIALPENLKAVMQTEGFEHLKVSCPSILTELLQYVAKAGEYSVSTGACVFEEIDGCDLNGRRLFFSYFKELVGKEVTVELKNDLAIGGARPTVVFPPYFLRRLYPPLCLPGEEEEKKERRKENDNNEERNSVREYIMKEMNN